MGSMNPKAATGKPFYMPASFSSLSPDVFSALPQVLSQKCP